MKIEATPEEIAKLITELQTQLMESDYTMELDDENSEGVILKISNKKRP